MSPIRNGGEASYIAYGSDDTALSPPLDLPRYLADTTIDGDQSLRDTVTRKVRRSKRLNVIKTASTNLSTLNKKTYFSFLNSDHQQEALKAYMRFDELIVNNPERQWRTLLELIE